MVKNPRTIRAGLVGAIAVCAGILFFPDISKALSGFFGKSAEDIPVVVADHFIPAFQALKAEDVVIKNFPREFVPPGALHSTSEILKDDGQVLYSSIVGIPEGQPLTRTLINETGKDHGMSSLLRPGKVAVSFKVDREKSAGGWVHPGDTIAIFQSVPMDLSNRQVARQTRLLLNSVEVLAVDRAHLGHDIEEEKPEAGLEIPAVVGGDQILTVLANTADASSIIEAQQAGPLTIALRPLGDDIPWLQPNHGGQR